MSTRVERLLDPAAWAFCWLAYWIVLALPTGRRNGPATWLWHKLLPFAGYYGFHAPGLSWRWSERNR